MFNVFKYKFRLKLIGSFLINLIEVKIIRLLEEVALYYFGISFNFYSQLGLKNRYILLNYFEPYFNLLRLAYSFRITK